MKEMIKLEESKQYIRREDRCESLKAWRIVELKDDKPHTLFHALPEWSSLNERRSREIPTDVWFRADTKWVRDGTGPYYWSGFNVLLERDQLKHYLSRFTKPRDLLIVACEVRGLRRKTHSRHPVYLADWMRLPSAWLWQAR